MPKYLSPNDVDPIAEEVDRILVDEGEDVTSPVHKFDPNQVGDLSDGGNVGGVKVVPTGASGTVNFDKPEQGRPNAREVWTWDNRASTIPLAWNAAGNQHDGGRRYLLKRHCVTCNFSGFFGRRCPACRKANRPQGGITPAFYLRQKDVPMAQVFFGKVDCLIAGCIRHGEYGFKSQVEMRQHAMSKHRMEYRAYQDQEASTKDTELVSLRQRLDALTNAALVAPAPVAAVAPMPGEQVVSVRRHRAHKPMSEETKQKLRTSAEMRKQKQAAGSAA